MTRDNTVRIDFLTQPEEHRGAGAGASGGAEGHDTNRQRVKSRSDPVTMTEFATKNEFYLRSN